jgi:hypothetical protein
MRNAIIASSAARVAMIAWIAPVPSGAHRGKRGAEHRLGAMWVPVLEAQTGFKMTTGICRAVLV